MISNFFIVEYLKKSYCAFGRMSQQFDNIFRILEVNRNEVIDAFYEIYSTDFHPALYTDYINIDSIHFPSTKLIQNLASIVPLANLERLAFTYIIYDITKEKITYFNENLSVNDINLALENIEVINFDIGAFMQSINTKIDYIQENDLKQSIQALGGLTRSRKYQVIKKQIFNDWNISNYHSYAECARKHSVIHRLSTKTIESWLSREFSKPKNT